MKWNDKELRLVKAYAYMTHYKQLSVYRATNDVWCLIQGRTWQAVRSQLNRERKAILWQSTPPLQPTRISSSISFDCTTSPLGSKC